MTQTATWYFTSHSLVSIIFLHYAVCGFIKWITQKRKINCTDMYYKSLPLISLRIIYTCSCQILRDCRGYLFCYYVSLLTYLVWSRYVPTVCPRDFKDYLQYLFYIWESAKVSLLGTQIHTRPQLRPPFHAWPPPLLVSLPLLSLNISPLLFPGLTSV